jgi:hypothetical protein
MKEIIRMKAGTETMPDVPRQNQIIQEICGSSPYALLMARQ